MPGLIELRLYSCFKCRNQVARQDDIISKRYQRGRRRRAFLFSHAENFLLGPIMERLLITGRYKVAYLYCKCGEDLGWKYFEAYDPNFQFKEGKVVLELSKIVLT